MRTRGGISLDGNRMSLPHESKACAIMTGSPGSTSLISRTVVFIGLRSRPIRLDLVDPMLETGAWASQSPTHPRHRSRASDSALPLTGTTFAGDATVTKVTCDRGCARVNAQVKDDNLSGNGTLCARQAVCIHRASCQGVLTYGLGHLPCGLGIHS